MRDLVMPEYSALDIYFHGGIAFSWICKMLFGFNRDLLL
jgi:hypothetical protein